MNRAALGLAFLVCLADQGVVWAQDASTADSAEGGQRRRVRKIDLDLDDLKVSGQIQKPQVQFLLSREQVEEVSPVDLDESFVGRIDKAVDDAPF